MGEVFVFVTDMPTGIRGHVNANKDGSYTIFINARLNHEQQIKAYLHEIKHIAEDDFYKNEDVNMIEYLARYEY